MMSLRQNVRRRLQERFADNRTVRSIWTSARFAALATQDRLWRMVLERKIYGSDLQRQAILEWNVDLSAATVADFLKALDASNIHYVEGSHTIYIPPQDQLNLV